MTSGLSLGFVKNQYSNFSPNDCVFGLAIDGATNVGARCDDL